MQKVTIKSFILKKVKLNNLKFHAPIGLYEEEKKVGTPLCIDISILLNETNDLSVLDDSDYLDYQKLYIQIENIANQPHDLLEMLASRIANALLNNNETIKEVDILITKLHPPIAAFTGSVSIQFLKTR